MKKTLLFLSFLISLIATAQTGTSTNYSMSSTSGGTTVTRTYRVYVPAMYDGSTPVPVVFNFHGLGSTMAQQEMYGDFRKIADTANFIIVHPQGLPTNMVLFTQNAFDLFFTTARSQPDIDFVDHLIDTIKARYNVNLGRIYSTGMSNGGFMSHEMACKLSGRFAAIASVCGSMQPAHFNSCNALHPTPVMQIHGTNDGVVKYDGTPGSTFITFTHVDTLVKHWVEFNNGNYSTPVIDTIADDPNPIDSARAVHYVWSGGNAPVELYKIIGGSHSWPNPTLSTKGVCKDFSACKEIWRFFDQHKSFVPSYTTGIEDQTNNDGVAFSVFPNPTNGQFTVSITNTNSKTVSISVVNILGETVYSYSDNNCANTVSKQINLENITAGIYFIKIDTGKDVTTQKIIIQ